MSGATYRGHGLGATEASPDTVVDTLGLAPAGIEAHEPVTLVTEEARRACISPSAFCSPLAANWMPKTPCPSLFSSLEANLVLHPPAASGPRKRSPRNLVQSLPPEEILVLLHVVVNRRDIERGAGGSGRGRNCDFALRDAEPRRRWWWLQTTTQVGTYASSRWGRASWRKPS